MRVTKLSSTRHKDTLLRAAHGDIYTREKLFRFGLIDSNQCPRCDEVETLRHKVIECEYAHKIWTEAIPVLEKLSDNIDRNIDMAKLAVSATNNTTLASMTLSTEILQVILRLRGEQTYLVHPKVIVRQAVQRLGKMEGNSRLKTDFIELLNDW